MSGLVEDPGTGDYEMQCFPLYSLILATGENTISNHHLFIILTLI
jgi:hypothetical protein